MQLTTKNERDLRLGLLKKTGQLTVEQSSNTISLYDIMPKYCRAKCEEKVVLKDVDSKRIYKISIGGCRYVICVHAAKIETDAGIEYHFPSTEEELIEDVLRHTLVNNRQKSLFDDSIGVTFSIFKIREQMEKHGKNRNNKQIRHSLDVLKKARVEVFLAQTFKNGKGDPIFQGAFFNDATVIDRNDYFNRKSKDSVHGLVKFHNMISTQVMEIEFKLLRYDICMQYKSDMARWLHKRISHMHTKLDKPYEIKLSTIYNDGNWKWHKDLSVNLRKFKAAIEQMRYAGMICAEKDVVINSEIENGRKIDARLQINLSEGFIKHIKMANTIQQLNKYHINEAGKASNELNDSVDINCRLLIDEGLSVKAAVKLGKEFTEDEIKSAVLWVKSDIEDRGDVIRNEPGYLINCLRKRLFQQGSTSIINLDKYEEPLKGFARDVILKGPEKDQHMFLANGIGSPRIKAMFDVYKESA